MRLNRAKTSNNHTFILIITQHPQGSRNTLDMPQLEAKLDSASAHLNVAIKGLGNRFIKTSKELSDTIDNTVH